MRNQPKCADLGCIFNMLPDAGSKYQNRPRVAIRTISSSSPSRCAASPTEIDQLARLFAGEHLRPHRRMLCRALVHPPLQFGGLGVFQRTRKMDNHI